MLVDVPNPSLSIDLQGHSNLLNEALRYACLSPSAHNAQPWKVRICASTLEIYLDTESIPTVSDPTKRESLISLGSFIESLKVSLIQLGFNVNLEFPAPYIESLYCIFNISESIEKIDRSKAIENLSHIINRQTNRSPFKLEVLAKDHILAFEEITTKHGLLLSHIDSQQQRDKVLELLKLSMKFGISQKNFREELSNYILPNNSNKRVGIPAFYSNFNFLQSIFLPFFIKNFDISFFESKREEEIYKNAPLYLIISSMDDSATSWIKTGMAYFDMSIYMTSNKIAHSVSGAPIEAPGAAPILRRIAEIKGQPLMFLRAGHASKVYPRSPRKSVSDILL